MKLLKKIVFKLFKIFVPESIKRELLIFHHLNESYSQEGEDLLLNRIFNKSNGFFIDIGAHHPKKYSNTAIFKRVDRHQYRARFGYKSFV